MVDNGVNKKFYAFLPHTLLSTLKDFLNFGFLESIFLHLNHIEKKFLQKTAILRVVG